MLTLEELRDNGEMSSVSLRKATTALPVLKRLFCLIINCPDGAANNTCAALLPSSKIPNSTMTKMTLAVRCMVPLHYSILNAR
jgi:hypothetical protein